MRYKCKCGHFKREHFITTVNNIITIKECESKDCPCEKFELDYAIEVGGKIVKDVNLKFTRKIKQQQFKPKELFMGRLSEKGLPHEMDTRSIICNKCGMKLTLMGYNVHLKTCKKNKIG